MENVSYFFFILRRWGQPERQQKKEMNETGNENLNFPWRDFISSLRLRNSLILVWLKY